MLRRQFSSTTRGLSRKESLITLMIGSSSISILLLLTLTLLTVINKYLLQNFCLFFCFSKKYTLILILLPLGIPLSRAKVQSSTVSFSDSLSRDDDFSKISSPDDLEAISKTIRNNLANSPPQRMLSTMAYTGPTSLESGSSFHSADMTRIMEEEDMAAMIAWQNSKTPKNFRFKSPHSVVIK